MPEEQHATSTSPRPSILIIDDKPADLRIIVDFLKERGFKISIATTGELGLTRADFIRPDLILLDIMMPGTNGFDICRRLKADEIIREIPVIFLTALTDTQQKVEAFKAGAVDYLTKPIQQKELVARITTHIKIRQLQIQLEDRNKRLNREIAGRKQFEAALQQSNAELRQRTTELEFANKELQDFAYIVSHELKAPLRGINQLVNWLLEEYAEAFDEQGQEFIQLLRGRVKRMNELINGVLRYSRAGRQMNQEEPIDVQQLVQETIEFLAPPEHIHWNIETDLPVLTSDRTRLEQVFQNLFSNAIRYMDKSRGEVRIGCIEKPSQWQWYVADNGSGIDARNRERIFQIFQTLRPHDEHESTGVGLAVVKKIVEYYGGTIWVESTPGKGSTFFFTLPK